MNYLIIDEIIKKSLIEDITNEDITTNSIVKKDSTATAELLCKEDGILSGIDIFERVFSLLGEVQVEKLKTDGDQIKKGELIAVLKGNTRNILQGERVALNLLQRMSGVATTTRKYVDELKGTNVALLDTRKTTPMLRYIEKYSVKVGGATNHRYNLSDAIMIKDNHIDAAGGITNAVTLARANASFTAKIEVETENLEMVKEALENKADIIMLDNMSIETATEAVKFINKRALTEFSGNVTIERLKEIATTGVDYISSGALTHSAKILDFSLKNLKLL